MKHFEQRREAAHQHFTQEFNGLMEQTVNRLQQFGGIIPSLKGMGSALSIGEKEALALAFEDHWPLLQLEVGLNLVRFYTASGEELGRWGDSDFIVREAQEIQSLLTSVRKKERPVTALSCSAACIQYVIAPILLEGKNIGAILIGSSLAEVIVNFRQISGLNVGVLIDSTQKANRSQEIRDPPRTNILTWNKDIVAMTNSDLMLPLLQSVAKEIPFHEIGTPQNIPFETQHYHFSLIPLKNLPDQRTGHLIIVDDISKTLAAIQEATWQSLFAGIVGLILSEGLLLMILWQPMARLRLIADTLPLLALSSFGSVRAAVGMRKKGWADDEIDILDDTAVALSSQLEALETEVNKRSLALAERMEELANEKDFVTHLLYTARVMILTQDKNGRIMMLNQYARTLIGYEASELMGKRFIDFVAEEELSTETLDGLGQLLSGEKEHFSHESLIISQNQNRYNILWFHSCLKRKGENEPVLLSVGMDLTARKQAELQLSWLADHDPLTGLFNRRRFQIELERVISQSKRYRRSGALLFFDLDQFKFVNDTSGHHAGDALLKVVASQLARLVRSTDIVSRLGGDEFALVVSETDEAGAIQVAQKVIDYLKGVEMPVLEHAYKVSASIGITLFPEFGSTVQELLSNADLAMYQAKENGGGRWHVYTGQEAIKTRLKERIYWKDKIQKAFDEDRFVMHYQPMQELTSGKILYYEALIRMHDQDNTLIAPGAFIPIAEQSGLIHEIDHMVIEKVITHQAELARKGIHVVFTLNLSGYAFNDPKLLPHLQEVLKESGADPRNIVIEITETAAVSDLVAACSLMNEIKALGCRFALDDFGTGFASFNYLKQLPVDLVKIGDIFIKEIISHSDDQIFVKSLCEVTKGLGKKTIAEGVEDAETLALLQEFGVDFAQGYFIGRPASQVREELL